MSEHALRRRDIRHTTAAYEWDGDGIQETEILETSVLDKAVPEYFCSCGKSDMSTGEAIEHMQDVHATVTPDTMLETAQRIQRGELVPTGFRDNGFVVKKSAWSGDQYCVGMCEDNDTFVVMYAMKRSETINSNSTRLKTQENEYVEATLQRVNIPQSVREDGDVTEYLSETDPEEEIGTGYVHGHRVTPLWRLLEETFRWYECEDGNK